MDGQKLTLAKPEQDTNHLFTTRQQLTKVSAIELTLPSAVVQYSTAVFDPGIIVDAHLICRTMLHRYAVTFNCGSYDQICVRVMTVAVAYPGFCERGGAIRGSVGRKSPAGSRGRAPGGDLGANFANMSEI